MPPPPKVSEPLPPPMVAMPVVLESYPRAPGHIGRLTQEALGRRRVLHLYSGPADRKDGLAAYLKHMGWDCDDVDYCNPGPDQDVACDETCEKWLAKLHAGRYAFVYSGMPCGSASHARYHQLGPRPLRSLEHPMGLPDLPLSEKEEVRLGNLHVDRTVQASRIVGAQGGGWAAGNPEPWEGFPTLFDLPLMADMAQDFDARHTTFDQCRFGGVATKPTRILYFGGAFETLTERCNHPIQEWRDGQGRTYRARHERVVGRKTDRCEYATKALAAYPGRLNRRIAACIASNSPLEVTSR